MNTPTALLVALAVSIAPAFADTTRPSLAYENAFGGHGFDSGVATATDSLGNVYVAGDTTSTDFPLKNALQTRLGGAPLRFSLDYGKTWTAGPLTETVTAVAGAANAPGVVYAASNSTIYKSVDFGKTWSPLKVTASQVTAIVVDPATPATVYVAAATEVLKSVDAGVTWAQVTPTESAVFALAMNPARPSTLLASFYGYLSVPGVYRSTDGGATWMPLANSPPEAIALAGDPSNPDVWYGATSNYYYSSSTIPAAIYKTVDNGLTWTKLTNAVVNSVTGLVVTPNAILAATDHGVISSRDGGATWTATSLNVIASALAVDPNNPQTIYASGGATYVSADGGTTWSTLLAVRQNVQTIVVLPGAQPILFVGAAPGRNIFVTKWSPDGRWFTPRISAGAIWTRLRASPWTGRATPM